MTKDELLAIAQAMAQQGDPLMMNRLAQIEQMPPDQQQAAIDDLSRDYESLTETARDTQEMGFEMMNAASPEGRMGPSQNPYSVYVAANPLEHLASGLRQYKGGKMMGESRKDLESLSEAQKRSREGMMRAGMQSAQAQALRDEEERKRRAFARPWGM